MKRLFVVLCLWIMTLPALAQEATPEPTPFAFPPNAEPMLIQDIGLTRTDPPTLAVVGFYSDGSCGIELTGHVERQGAVLFVDQYHPGNTDMCTIVAVDLTMPLPELAQIDANETLADYLVVNQFYFRVNWTEADTDITPSAPALESLTNLVRTSVIVDEVTLAPHEDGYVYAMIHGWLPEGGGDPVLYRVLRTSDSEHVYIVDVFRALTDPTSYPLHIVPEDFEIAIKTLVQADEIAVFKVGDEEFSYTSSNMPVEKSN